METNPSPKEAKPGDLITYYLGGSNTKELYNDVQVTNPGKSTSTAQTFMVTGLPAECVLTESKVCIAGLTLFSIGMKSSCLQN